MPTVGTLKSLVESPVRCICPGRAVLVGARGQCLAPDIRRLIAEARGRTERQLSLHRVICRTTGIRTEGDPIKLGVVDDKILGEPAIPDQPAACPCEGGR